MSVLKSKIKETYLASNMPHSTNLRWLLIFYNMASQTSVLYFWNNNYFAMPWPDASWIALLTHRNPYASYPKHTSANPGVSLYRLEQRALWAPLAQLPPRNTRSSPTAGPVGFSTGLF